MNCRTAKKIRKYSQRNWMQYFNTMRTWPFGVKLRFCWQLMFGMGKKPKRKLSKEQVLKARRPVTEGAKV